MTMRQYLCGLGIFMGGFFCSEFLKKKEYAQYEQHYMIPVGEEITMNSSDQSIKYKLIPHNIQIDGKSKKLRDFDKDANIIWFDLGNHVIVYCTKKHDQ